MLTCLKIKSPYSTSFVIHVIDPNTFNFIRYELHIVRAVFVIIDHTKPCMIVIDKQLLTFSHTYILDMERQPIKIQPLLKVV